MILSQLQEGEAYRLERDKDGVVRTHLIPSPSNASMADILNDVFNIDLNAQKLANISASSQQAAKHKLLSLIKEVAK